MVNKSISNTSSEVSSLKVSNTKNDDKKNKKNKNNILEGVVRGGNSGNSSCSSKGNDHTTTTGTTCLLCAMFRMFVHIFAALHHWYAIYYFMEMVNIPESVHRMGNKFGGKFKYLTFLNLILQAIYFTTAFLNDLIGSNEILSKKHPKIRLFKDNLFATLAFPVNIDVGVVFWILYAIDRELVLPESFDPYFPGWLNHMIHTNILVFIILEFFLSSRTYPRRTKGISILMIFLSIYLVWVHIIKHVSGIWVYPVLDVLNFPQRILFFSGMLLWSAFVYVIGDLINNLIWSKEISTLIKQKKNSKLETEDSGTFAIGDM